MKAKVQNIKSKRPKNLAERLLVHDVAAICGCSTRMVVYILNEERKGRSALGEKIQVVAMHWEKNREQGLADVKRFAL
jgi:hypothetical protein